MRYVCSVCGFVYDEDPNFDILLGNNNYCSQYVEVIEEVK